MQTTLVCRHHTGLMMLAISAQGCCCYHIDKSCYTFHALDYAFKKGGVEKGLLLTSFIVHRAWCGEARRAEATQP